MKFQNFAASKRKTFCHRSTFNFLDSNIVDISSTLFKLNVKRAPEMSTIFGYQRLLVVIKMKDQKCRTQKPTQRGFDQQRVKSRIKIMIGNVNWTLDL